MKTSLNEILLCVPVHQLNFLTPFPKEEIDYEQVVTTISNQWLSKKTVLLLEKEEDIRKLNDKNVVIRFIQDPHLLAIIICKKSHFSIHDQLLSLYKELQIPIIHIEDTALSSVFSQETMLLPWYSQFSVELSGFMNKGFMHIASNLSIAFATPMVFLDENKQLLWQTGHEAQVKNAIKWLTAQHELQVNQVNLVKEQNFKQYTMNIAGQVKIYVVTSAHLVEWQERFIDKFIALTAVVFQTDELVREQNERFKEFFVYELLYRKFESKKVLVKQGKTWGWNLEKAHHLLVVQTNKIESANLDVDWMDEMVLLLETKKQELHPPLIFLPFQDLLVIFVEDDEERAVTEQKRFVLNVANWVAAKIAEYFPTWKIQIGIGKWYNDTISLNKSFQEAKIAMQFGEKWFGNQQIFHISDIGVPHLLTHVHREILHDFCNEYLAELIDSDEKKDTDYMQTLKMYLQHQGIITDVSKALFIHPNTLRNRIKKIEEITGVDLQNLDELLNLMVALKVFYSFFHKNHEKN
ncbi:helix-turn-helix domain-containing protein [Bacillus sp. B15-48]|uniref:PucR family transcriptional regulator n=1 Tax=Bacillus sp. B15-48 TaxID=1548601 RepID=UPI00193FF4A3|nr:helix-turn-helix domain-containing protein [Bacillus sp. B15-48]MBM4765346.1 hypothetical protein [Bacillus sp. B15-48]